MILRLFLHIVSGVLGLYLATRFVSGVEFTGEIKTLLIIGAVLGLANFFIKPILNIISFPLRILTLGLFGIVINILLVWLVVDVFFTENIEINGIVPLLWTTFLIWIFNFLFGFYKPKRKYRHHNE